VSLEFYQKKRRWPFAPENIPWEVWTVRIDLVPIPNKLFYSSLMLKKGLSFAYG
jgi:hypothetical protein